MNSDKPTYVPGPGRAGALARLAREDWSEMTAAANASPNHPGSTETWMRQAREQDPDASGEDIARIAAELRANHYRALGGRSAQSRRDARGQDMMAAANASPMHPNSPERWPALARQQHPAASEEEITRIAADLRAAHYRRIWETRRANDAALMRAAARHAVDQAPPLIPGSPQWRALAATWASIPDITPAVATEVAHDRASL